MRTIWLSMSLLFCVCGCKVADEAARPSPRTATGTWTPRPVTHVQVEVQPLEDMPNSGLLLPVVSPDGQWAACLRWAGARAAEPQALFSGEGLEPMSLILRQLRQGGETIELSKGGACWPTWSADSAKLAFITVADGRCDICVYDLSSRRLSRHSLSAGRAAMPAISADGQRAALLTSPSKTKPLVLTVVDLASGSTQEAPLDGKTAHWPQWTRDGRVLFLLDDGQEVSLTQWGPGLFPPETICTTGLTASTMGVFQALACIGRPLSQDERRFAFYDAAQDRMVLLDLPAGARTELPAGTRCGCWLADGRFAAADENELRLYGRGEESMLIMRGLWLPLGADRQNRMTVASRGSNSRAFAAVRMTLTLD